MFCLVGLVHQEDKDSLTRGREGDKKVEELQLETSVSIFCLISSFCWMSNVIFPG